MRRGDVKRINILADTIYWGVSTANSDIAILEVLVIYSGSWAGACSLLAHAEPPLWVQWPESVSAASRQLDYDVLSGPSAIVTCEYNNCANTVCNTFGCLGLF